MAPAQRAALQQLLPPRIRHQRPRDQAKLYTLHAPKAECISKGNVKQRYELDAKARLTERDGLIFGARTLTSNRYDEYTLAGRLQQTNTRMQNIRASVEQMTVDLGFRDQQVEADNSSIKLIHRSKLRSSTKSQRKILRQRLPIEPVRGHRKDGHDMRRYWLKGATEDVIPTVPYALSYNPSSLLQAIALLSLRAGHLCLV